MKKNTKLALLSITLITPFVPLLGYSTFMAFAYLGYWVVATALIARFILKPTNKETKLNE